MAEALALAAGVFACVTIVGSLAKDSKSLSRSVRLIKVAGKEIEVFRKDVHNYKNVIGMACAALTPFEHLSRDDNSPVLQYMLDNDVWTSMVAQCESVKEDISKHVLDIRKLRRRSQWMASLKWIFQKREIEALGPRMESVKCSLEIMMSSIQLDTLRSLPRTKALDMEIKRLKGQIEMFVETIEELKEKLETTRSTVADRESADKFASLNRNVENAIQDLGESMVYERCVPGHPPPTTSPTASSISTKSRGHRSSTINTSASTYPLPQRNRSRISVPVVAPSESSTFKTTKGSTSHPISRISETRRTAATTRDIGGHHETLLPTADIITSSSPERGFLAVRKTSTFLHLDPFANYRAEAGYISTPTGYRSTTARLDEQLDENLITQAFAARYQLKDVELFDMDDLASSKEGIWVQIGDGKRERCVGKVALQWRIGTGAGSVEFPVTCWVCVHGDGVGDVVFGRRFTEKKQYYYWRDGKDGE